MNRTLEARIGEEGLVESVEPYIDEPGEPDEDFRGSSYLLCINERELGIPIRGNQDTARKQAEWKLFYETMNIGMAMNDFGLARHMLSQEALLRFFHMTSREAISYTFSVNYQRTATQAQDGFEKEVLTKLIGNCEETGYSTEQLSLDFLVVFRFGKIVGVYSIVNGGGTQKIYYTGDMELGKRLRDILSGYANLKKEIFVNRVTVYPNQEIGHNAKTLKERRPVTNPEAFWPFAPMSPRAMAEAFEASDSNVLILYGEPGLGKSQYIAEMVKWKSENTDGEVYICDDSPVFKSVRFTAFVHGIPNGGWLVTEDAHEMIAARDTGNSLMAAVLNAAEGITSGNVKFIVSTNITTLKDVDDALYRPGRTFRVIPFKPLNAIEANNARLAVGLDTVDFGNETKLSLASALNWEAYQALIKEVKQAGFISR